ncbi:MAG: hypothetical protein OXI80_11545, partial [Caldilineaceae bacterium]|nr:hypothetical protein [Caldilineaceae bacterium]
MSTRLSLSQTSRPTARLTKRRDQVGVRWLLADGPEPIDYGPLRTPAGSARRWRISYRTRFQIRQADAWASGEPQGGVWGAEEQARALREIGESRYSVVAESARCSTALHIAPGILIFPTRTLTMPSTNRKSAGRISGTHMREIRMLRLRRRGLGNVTRGAGLRTKRESGWSYHRTLQSARQSSTLPVAVT